MAKLQFIDLAGLSSYNDEINKVISAGDAKGYKKIAKDANLEKIYFYKDENATEASAPDYTLDLTEFVKNGTIGALTDLKTTDKASIVNAINELFDTVEGATSSIVTIENATTPTEGYLKTYIVKQGEVEVGKIDIPKDLVVTSGEVVALAQDEVEGKDKGTYIKLTIANQDTPLYINVADLVDLYTAEHDATQIQLTVSSDNEISATIVAGSVTATELSTEVNDSLAKADTALQKTDITSGTSNGTIAVGGTDVEVTGINNMIDDKLAEAVPVSSITALFAKSE